MRVDRRRFVKTASAGALAALGSGETTLARGQAAPGKGTMSYDVAVIGAGVFGSWTALHLRKAGRSVVLLDAYGPGNARASSGGESRVIRMGYGADELYTRWSMRSLGLWKELFGQAGQALFHETGVLWMSREQDKYASATLATLKKMDVRHERLARSELESRFPQIDFGPVSWANYEPESGVLMARRAVQAVVDQAVRQGVEMRIGAAAPPSSRGRLDEVRTRGGDPVRAGSYVFACGPWLPKVFPELLEGRIFPTRQEVFFFGVPAGDRRFSAPAMPVWIDFGDETYGIPDLESRGFKIAPDRHGPAFDPDSGERTVTAETLAGVRAFLGRRFPGMKDAPLVETRVCQYENTSSGDFLIDRHPELENVWLVGGGSGHGFKHGPALGEYVSKQVLEGGPVERRFSLATKEKVQKRSVY